MKTRETARFAADETRRLLVSTDGFTFATPLENTVENWGSSSSPRCPMLPQQLGGLLGLVKSRVVQWRRAFQVVSIQVCPMVYQQFGNSGLIGVSRRMERGRSPVLIA